MSEYIPYQPPEPEFNDTLLAFQAFAGPRMAALVEPDPLGPVNQKITLMAGKRRIKTVLWHISSGATVTIGRDPGTPLVQFFCPDWRQLNGYPGLEIAPPRPASWYVEVDGRRVIDVPEHETYPPIPPRPPIPLRQHVRRAVRDRLRAGADATAHRLGYHRDDDCPGWDA